MTRLWFLLLTLAAAAQPYHLEITPVQRVRVVLSEAITAPRLEATEWGIYMGCPPDSDGQRLERARLRALDSPSAAGHRICESSPLRQRVLFVRYRGGQRHSARVEATYELQLNARRLVPGAGPARALRAAEKKAYLASEDPIDHQTASFRAWMDSHGLRRQRGEADLALARRVFQWLAGRFEYRWVEDSDNRASVVCTRGWGHCGSLSDLFAAVLRVNGVPARTLVGRWARSSGPPGDPFRDRDHVKAEFYLAGVGWVPADLASAILRHDVEAHFGQERGDFLVLHYDNVQLDRPRSLQSAQFSGGKYAGSWEGWTRTREILVTASPR